MSPEELQRYLHEHIPLSGAMQVTVNRASPAGVVLSAPLEPNINHRETVFGGSASALAILAAWSLLHLRLLDEGIAARVVIRRNTMEYEAPIHGRFSATSLPPGPGDWVRFLRMFERKGKARIELSSVLGHADRIVGRMSGEFVALGATDV